LHYEISSQFVHLGDIFDKMEKALSERDSSIQEYSVSQNTLDNVCTIYIVEEIRLNADSNVLIFSCLKLKVFINFVKNQNDCDLDVAEMDMSLHSRNMSDMSANIVLDMSLPVGSQCDRIEEHQDHETVIKNLFAHLII